MRRAAWLALMSAALVGLFARLHALGYGPLAVDEYYFLISVESILEDGLPTPPGGGYYVRGIVLQYLTAISVLLFESREFAVRFPAALLGLLTAVVAYVYGSRTGGRWLGWALAIAVLLSSWSVEFSRFGRMYSAFQLLTLLFLLSLHPVVAGRAAGARRYLPHLLLALLVLTHQLGLLLAPLVALPLILSGRTHRLGGRRGIAAYTVATAVAYVAVLMFRFIPFRTIGVSDAYPAPAGGAGTELAQGPGLLRLPAFPFWTISASATANLAFAVGAVVLTGVLVHAFRRDGRRFRSEDVAAAMAVTAAALHQFVVVAALVMLLVFRYRIYRDPARHRLSLALGALAAVIGAGWIALVGWLSYGAGSLDWVAAAGAGGVAGAARSAFFGWPDLYTPLLVPWSREMPILTLLLMAGVTYQLATRLDRRWPEIVLLPAVVVAYVAILFGVLDSLYHTTRYGFFVYPVALAALFMSVADVLERLPARRRGDRSDGWSRARRTVLAPVACLVLFAITEDFDARHLMRVASEDVRFRIGAYEGKAATWYSRLDYETPGRVVGSQAGPEDVVVLIDAQPTSYYLDRPHAIFLERDDPRFGAVSRVRGTRDFWSGQRLLSTPAELEGYANAAPRVWVVRPARGDPPDPASPVGAALGDRVASATRAHLSRDGRIEVVRVDLAD